MMEIKIIGREDFEVYLERCSKLLGVNVEELNQPEWNQYWQSGQAPEEAVFSLIKSISDNVPQPQLEIRKDR